jgi:DNA-binding GntR family transcriptional regulator
MGRSAGERYSMRETPEAAVDQKAFVRARNSLLLLIGDGTFAPDERLTEAELVNSLGVSRSTVRLVLTDLSKDGYVVLERNRGARVRSFSVEESIEILQVRERLEGMAAGLAAERATPEGVATLESVVAEMELVAAARDSDAYSRLNRRLHAQILDMARNNTLSRLLRQTHYQLVMRQFRNLDASHPRHGSLDEHRAIMVAIRANDAVAAERMMRLHLTGAREALKLRPTTGPEA